MAEWLDLDDLLDKGHDLLEIGMCDEALKLLEQYRDMYPADVEMELLYAQIYTEDDKPDKALPFLHRGLELEKDNVDCLLGLFYAYSQSGNIEKGAEYLLRAEQLAPDVEAVVGSMLWYLNEHNRSAEAVTYFESRRRLHIENAETFRNAGVAYQRVHRHDEAEACFRAALELNAGMDEARDLLADSYIYRGDGAKAVEVYREFLTTSPRNVRAMSRLVFALCQNEQYDEAVKQAAAIMLAYPNSPVGYVDMAYVHLNRHQLDLALESVQRALDISPLDPEAHRVAGVIYSEKEENDKAEEQFLSAVALDPENVEIKRDFYQYLRDVGEYDRMLTLVHEVIGLEHPYCLEDCWFLAEFYRDEGENLAAFHYLREAYHITPGETELIPALVDIMLDRGRLSPACRFMAHYVRQAGWDEVMDQLTRHRRLRDARSQEGLRMLRCLGQKPPEFHRYIHAHFLLQFLRAAAALVLVGCCVEATLLFGAKGALASAALGVGSAVGWFGFRFVKKRFFVNTPVAHP